MEVFKEDVALFTKEVKEKLEKGSALTEEDFKILFMLNVLEEEAHEK